MTNLHSMNLPAYSVPLYEFLRNEKNYILRVIQFIGIKNLTCLFFDQSGI